MAWRESTVSEERVRFVLECVEGDEGMSALCAEYGISRKTGYKWLARYRTEGAAGLSDRSRAPLVHGRATSLDLVERIVAEKEAHPQWGPKKVLARLQRREPEAGWPAASTIGEILKRHGLVKGRKRARWRASGNGPWPAATDPNVVWTVDYKGWFKTRDGKRCEPLTVLDFASRYLLGLAATGSTREAEAWPRFERLFGEYGLPDRLRSDNGAPFASTGVAGLTRLSVRFIQLGIRLERIAPGKPQQNGQHERFHGTMLPLATSPATSLEAQQEAFDAFRREYNTERPHEALGQTPPAEHYVPSETPMPSKVPEPDYPAEAAVRRVRHSGEIKWQGELVYISEALVGEPVAIEETDGGEWTVRFYAHPLGVIDPRHKKLRRRSVLPVNGQHAAAAKPQEL